MLFRSVFVSQKAITSYIEGKDIIFDEKWAMNSGLTIAGYAAFNMLESFVPKVPAHQPLVNDLIKVSMGALAANYFVDGTINHAHLLNLASLLSGFVAFHMVSKQFVVPKEKFEDEGGHSTMPDHEHSH